MARIPYVEEKDHPELARLIGDIRARRGGQLSAVSRMLLHSPPVAEGWLYLMTAIRQQTTIPARHRELVMVRIAVLNKARFEYEAHVPHALEAGVTQAQIDDLERWRESGAFDAEQRAVLACTDAMTTEVEVPDAAFAAVRAIFDDRQLTELTATVAAYNMVSRFLVAMRIGAKD